MTSKYILAGIAVGIFLAGLGTGYAIFMNTLNPYQMMSGNPSMFNQMMGKNPQVQGQYMSYMMQNPQYMSQFMTQNPQYMGQWMGTIMQDPQLRQQMYHYMLQNQDFMYQMMKDRNFQNTYMGPWMMQNNFTYNGMMWHR
ncbi:MAG: hypothetical protein ABI342_06955 [Nitrososphaera sp.]|jgi:hypothetical protein